MDLRERAKPDPQSREEVQRWALVGAYERDNMGDFLLLRATELLLARPGRNPVRTAPFTPAPGPATRSPAPTPRRVVSPASRRGLDCRRGRRSGLSAARVEHVRPSCRLELLPGDATR